MKIQLTGSAVEVLDVGRRFYAVQGPDLGVYFLDSLTTDIDSLLLYAGIHEQRFGHYRLLAARFPFAVYYTIEGETFLVRRVLDCRRNPQSLGRALA